MAASDVWLAYYFYQALEILNMMTRFLNETHFFPFLIVLTVTINIIGAGLILFPRFISLPFMQKEKSFITSIGLTLILTSIVIGILKPSFEVGVYAFNGHSWHKNPHIKSVRDSSSPNVKIPQIAKFLLLYPLELSGKLTKFINDNYKKDDDHINRSYFGYKAILSSLTTTIQDPAIQDLSNLFIEKCVIKGIIRHENLRRESKASLAPSSYDPMLGRTFVNYALSRQNRDFYRGIEFSTENGKQSNCEELREKVNQEYTNYILNDATRGKLRKRYDPKNSLTFPKWLGNFSWIRTNIASNFTKFLLEKQESSFGDLKVATSPDTLSRMLSWNDRRKGIDGVISTLSYLPFVGDWFESKRGIDFHLELRKKFASESKLTAHIVGGFILILFGFFPFLGFFLLLNRNFEIVKKFIWIYSAVLLYQPISLIFYKIINAFHMRLDRVKEFSEITSDYSLMGVTFLSQRIHHVMSAYFIIQGGLMVFILMFSSYQLISMLQSQPKEQPKQLTGLGG